MHFTDVTVICFRRAERQAKNDEIRKKYGNYFIIVTITISLLVTTLYCIYLTESLNLYSFYKHSLYYVFNTATSIICTYKELI